MKYLILIHLDEKRLADLPTPELDTLNGAHLDYNDTLRASGHFVAAEALQPSPSGKVVKLRGGKTAVIDGPFAETKEMVAGFYLVEAKDIDEAVSIAAKLPVAFMATIEVRPTMELIVPGR